MHDEFHALTKALNISLLSTDDIATLHHLQRQWEHWTNRERQHAPARVVEEQRAAFDGFLDNPTPETEQRLLVTADANLTSTRYAVLRRACASLRRRISAQAARIVHATLSRALEALHTEHERRRETAEPVMSSRDRNPLVVEVRRVVEFAESLLHRAYSALNGSGEVAPLVLADVLVSEAAKLTAEERQ